MEKSLAQSLLDPNSSESSLYWRMSHGESALHMGTDPDRNTDLAIPLSEESVSRIRAMTVTTSSVAISIQLNGYDVPVHLIGRKISCTE